MSASALMIAYNEEELLPSCLSFLESMKQIAEIICVVDQDSTDRTVNILEHYAAWSTKRVAYQISKFETFGSQRNKAIDMATQDWLLTIDADEVFTPQLDGLLKDIESMPHVNAVRMPRIMLYKDRRHYLDQETTGLDPHACVWRRGFARYTPGVHEDLQDVHGRKLHICGDADVLSTHEVVKYHDVGVKHMQLLKSDAALMDKGLRWKETGSLEASAKKGIPVDVKTWLEWKHWAFRTHKILTLPERWYDVTSNW